MAEIPRAALDEFTRQVNAVSADAQEKVLRILEAVEWTPENIAACRAVVSEAVRMALDSYTLASAQAAADFYDASRELCVGETLGAVAMPDYDPDATDGAIRALVQDIVDGRPVEQFNRKVLDRVDYEVKRSAAESTMANARRDPLKPKWARVPTGTETCGFCFTLASRGFVYKSEKSAEGRYHGHPGCDCRIVCSWDSDSVEGYDPDALYERYADARAAVEGDARDAWLAAGGKDGTGKTFDEFLSSRIAREIELRDRDWAWTGKMPEVEFDSEGVLKRATEAEKRTARRLAGHGYKAVFIQDFEWVVGDDGIKRKAGLPDLKNGMEIKTLGSSANAWGAMKNYMDSAVHKRGLRCLVVDNSESENLGDDELISAARGLISDYPDIPHLKLLLKSGALVNVK